jgi:hypothetical protein
VASATDTAGAVAAAVGEGATSNFQLTTGWYVFIGLAFGVLTSETQIAPLSLGLLSVALLYQITQLVEGK